MKLFSFTYKWLPVLATVMLVNMAQAQFAYDYKRSADKFYAAGDYYSAADNYEKLLNAKSAKGTTTEPYTVQGKGTRPVKGGSFSHDEIVYRIAECYRQLDNYAKAEKWYGEAAAKGNQFPLAAYWYGVSLRANGKFPEAEKSLQSFLAAYRQNDAYKEKATLELASVQFIQQQLVKKDIALYTINGVSVNAGGADYAAAWNNGLVFTSTRADSTVLNAKNKNPYVNNLYAAPYTDGVLANPAKLVLPVTDQMEQGVASFTADGNTMYFTRWVKKNGKSQASIYVTKQQNGAWSAPEAVNAKINVAGYSAQEPQVTPDGKYLLFASDKPGGQGGFDLYYAALNANGQPGAVNSFGNTINTKDDDRAPFFYAPAATLVFATKGRVGMGGFDLFTAKGNVGGNWEQPVNLGYPVNSIKDDIYFFNKGTDRLLKDAYISTDRSSECCLQLFTVNKVYKKYVTGQVTDCKTAQPLAAVNVKVSGGTNTSLTTDANGNYFFEVPSFQAMQYTGSKDNYTNGELKTDQSNPSGDTLTNPSFCLSPVEVVVTPPPVEEKKTELKAYFDFAKFDLRPETGVLLDTIVAILKREPKLGVEIYGFTDKKGTDGYNLNLSKQRAEACKNYLVQNGIAAERLVVIPKGECCEAATETKADGSDDADARQKNRRVEFKIILQSI